MAIMKKKSSVINTILKIDDEKEKKKKQEEEEAKKKEEASKIKENIADQLLGKKSAIQTAGTTANKNTVTNLLTNSKTTTTGSTKKTNESTNNSKTIAQNIAAASRTPTATAAQKKEEEEQKSRITDPNTLIASTAGGAKSSAKTNSVQLAPVETSYKTETEKKGWLGIDDNKNTKQSGWLSENVKQVTPVSKMQTQLAKGVSYGKVFGNTTNSSTKDTETIKGELNSYIKDYNTLKDLNENGMSNNPRVRAEQTAAMQRFGMYTGKDYKQLNSLDLNKLIKDTESKLATAQANEKKKDNRELLLQEEKEAADKQKVIDTLATKGVPFKTNFDGNYTYTSPEKYHTVLTDDDYLKKRPEDYYYADEYRMEYDRALYDALNGEGAYQRRNDEIMENGTSKDFDQFESEMDELWNMVESGSFEDLRDQSKYFEAERNLSGNFGTDLLQGELDKLNSEKNRRSTISEMEANKPVGQFLLGDMGQYNQNAVNTFKRNIATGKGAGRVNTRIIPEGSEIDKLYWYANNIPGDEAKQGEVYANLQPAWFMTENQLRTFNSYYNTGDKESAKAYYDALLPALEQMQMDYRDELEYEMSKNEYAPLMVGQRVLLQPAAGVQGVVSTFRAMAGDKDAQNKNSMGSWGLVRTMQNVQGSRAEEWGNKFKEWFGDTELADNVGKWFNGVVYSMLDNMVARGVGMGASAAFGLGQISDVASTMIQFIMSSEATANEMYSNLKNDMDPTEAVIRAFGSGAIEWITENYSTDKFFENYGNGSITRQMIAGFVPEAQEEAAGKILETMMDEALSNVYNHESEFRQSVNAYKEELKRTRPELSEKRLEEEAFYRAMWDWTGDLLSDALAGGVSGAAMGLAGGVQAKALNFKQDTAIGERIYNQFTAENATESEKSTQGAINRVSVIEMAQNMPEGTESREKGEAAYKKVTSGKKVSDAEYGGIIRAIAHDTDESATNVVKNVLGQEIETRLKAMGEPAENIKPAAASLVNMVAGVATQSDLLNYVKSKNMQTLLQEYKMTDEGIGQKRAEVEKETQKLDSIRENVAELLAKRPEVSTNAVKNVVKDAKVAAKSDIIAAGKSSGSVTEVLTDGKLKEIAGIRVEGEGDEKHIEVQFTDNTSADIAQVAATNISVAQVLEYAGIDKGKTLTDKVANVLLKNVTKGADATKLIAGAVKISWDVATEQKTTNSGLNQATAEKIREAALADKRAAEDARQKNYRQINPGEGITTFKGVAYGTNAFNEAIRGLNKQTRNEAVTIAEIAKTAGFDVTLTNDAAKAKEQGSYSSENGIVINLAGEYRDGVERSAIATLAHEATHQLEGNSPEAYTALRSFVLQAQKRQGINLEERLQNIMNSYAKEGVELNMYDAVSEMVAKSCEEVLTNEKIVNRMAEEDPTLYGKVKNTVSMIVGRVRQALTGVKTTSSIYAQTMREYSDKLADVWLSAYQEARNARGAGEGTLQAFAMQETDGDEDIKIKKQINSSLDKLNNSEPIIEISSYVDLGKYRKEGAMSDDAAYKKWANELAESINREVYRTNLGRVALTSKSIKKGLGYLDNGPQKAAFAAVPAVIQYGDEINYHEKHKGGQANSHTYAGKIMLDGKPQLMAVVVRYSEDEHRYKTHEVFMPDGTVLKLENNKAEVANTPAEGFQQEHISSASDKIIAQEENGRKSQRSIQESDAEYDAAVKSGDTETQRRIVDEAAKAAGYTDRAYHGSPSFGFTEFDLKQGQDTIFVAYSPELAATYTHGGKVKNISEGLPFTAKDLKNENGFWRSDDTILKYLDKMGIKYEESTDEFRHKTLRIPAWDSSFTDRGHTYTTKYNETVGQVAATLYKNYFDETAKQLGFKNSDKTEGIYDLYTNPGNQLVIDAKGARWKGITGEMIIEAADNDIDAVMTFEDGKEYTTREIAAWAMWNGYDSVRINNVYDSGGRNMDSKKGDGFGDIGIFFSTENVKSADAVVYDDNNKVIKPSERFNSKKTDIRYSIADDNTITDKDGNAIAEVLPSGNVTAYSLRTVEDTVNEDLVSALVARGFNGQDVEKWVRDVYGVAKYIADHKMQLDFTAVDGTMLKNNQEYVKTLDASTLCAKRLLYQGIFNEIQSMLPNTPLLPDDLIKLINMMKKKGIVTPCAFCYVESRRKMLGKYASEWLKGYNGEYIPKLAEVTTTDGLEKLRMAPEGSAEHQAYQDFVDAMNAKGSANPKVVQLRTDYKGEIRKLTDNQIEKVKEIGGLRVQSFSDFETVHLLDMMQAVMDMAAMDLTSQAYTKVPAFAWVFGDTGIKINLSLVGDGNGVDENGKLLFSNTEGMDLDEAMALRKRYSKNVGTILVGMNEKHIIAAMGDDRIDFIIPFHKSGWSKNELLRVSGMSGYKDFTRYQNEKRIATDANGKPIRNANGKGYKTIPNKTSKISNYGPVNTKQQWNGQSGYWDFSKSGIENAEEYLRLCAEDGRLPKFYNFLIDNGDGSYRLPTEAEARADKQMANIRKGYWKTLIDFKMYDNEGNGSPQTTVKPVFNMDAAMNVLENYKEDPDKLPTDHDIAKRFVEEKKKENTRKKQWSIQDETDQDIRSWMMTVKADALQNDAERALLKRWQDMNTKVELKAKQIHELQTKIAQMKEMVRKDDFKNNSKDAQRKIREWTVQLENARTVRDQAQAELAKIESDEGYGRMMQAQTRRFNEFQSGKTQAEVAEEIGNLQKASERIGKEISDAAKRIKEIEGKGIIAQLKKILGTTTADQTAAELKREFHSSWTKGEIRNYLDPILLKLANGQDISDDVAELAGILIDTNQEIQINDPELAELRGETIVLNESQQRELRAQNSSLKEVRAKLAGTGITVKFGKKGEKGTLVENLGNFQEEYPFVIGIGDEKDALNDFLDWVKGRKDKAIENTRSQQGFDGYLADTMAQIYGKVVATAKGFYVPTEARAQKQVMALVEFVKGLNAQTEEAVKAMEKAGAEAQKLFGSGKNANEAAQKLIGNMNEALEYYNLSAKLAMQHAKQERNNAIIEQLKSKHAQEIAKRNTEWRELMERDAEARKTAESIRGMQSRMNTALKRTYRLLTKPKGLQNIPEPMQGLARELVKTFVDNDLAEGYRTKLTLADRGQLKEAQRILQAMEKESGPYDPLQLNGAEEAVQSVAGMDLATIQRCINRLSEPITGKNRLDTMQQKAAILEEMTDAVTEIYRMIRKEGEINIRDRQIAAEDQADKVMRDTKGQKYREWTGKAGNAIRTLHKAIVGGNMTPEYFFRMLGNEGLSELWENYHDAENRNGLALKAAKDRLAEIAEKYGYDKWDMKQKITLKLENGDVDVTLGQLMSLWATWKRETATKEAMTQHLTEGGFYAAPDLQSGILGRQAFEKKATRIRATQNEDGTWESKDMALVESLLTDEQLKFIDDVVSYMSNEMSELGNEASLKAFGIRLYKEKYYFPFQVWNGVKSQKSNESGVNAGQDRAFHQSFTLALTHKAKNAIMMDDFMKTAADHIAGMINYATMGLANENLQKVLNVQLYENVDTEGFSGTKRNLQAILEEAYGKEAMQYLNELKTQLNGGAVRVDKTFYDRLISLFRKNAVAGSLSVALQQPLSYIRASMLMNPKYLAQALNPIYWKGSYAEMLKHSGVAVIKDMGRFDMNFGQSAREFLIPDGMESKPRQIWNAVEDYSTKLPELMDRMTWTRMWSAVKAEQKAQHPEMDTKSEEFLDRCGERFNEIMRRTQVYDSVLVKSANMRSQSTPVKMITSFMAEPTLTLNVLADSVRMAKNHENGGAGMAGKAAATFLLSAVLQAFVKGLMGSGRNPDDKKTWLENFLYRFEYNFLNEADPLQLIPGFSDAVDLLKGNDLKDDAYGAISKMISAAGGVAGLITGDKELGWQSVEDSIGQLIQLFTGVPAKNISRDTRAMWNFFIGRPYAEREENVDVMLGQAKDLFYNADNLIGVVNKWLGEAGYDTSKNGYYKQIYDAKKEGRYEDAQSMIDYLIYGKGVKEEAINKKMNTLTKEDDSLTAEEKANTLIMNGASSADDYIRQQLREGNMTAEEARRTLLYAQPGKTADDVWWQVDRIEYQLETGTEKAQGGNSYYYRLKDAINANKSAEIKAAVQQLLNHGITKDKIKNKLSDWKKEYLAAKGSEKVAIKNALIIAYKAIGISEKDANEIINKWK